MFGNSRISDLEKRVRQLERYGPRVQVLTAEGRTELGDDLEPVTVPTIFILRRVLAHLGLELKFTRENVTLEKGDG